MSVYILSMRKGDKRAVKHRRRFRTGEGTCDGLVDMFTHSTSSNGKMFRETPDRLTHQSVALIITYVPLRYSTNDVMYLSMFTLFYVQSWIWQNPETAKGNQRGLRRSPEEPQL
eukprot:6422149-Pyramimonas_sp.AAC.1